MHNVDNYGCLTEIQQIESILRSDFETCPLHILINNRQYSVVALLISLGLCKNEEKNIKSSTIDDQTLKSINRFIEIYYKKKRDVDYFTTVSKKANKLTDFLNKGDIKSDAYIIAKKDFFKFFNEHQTPNHDYSATYKEPVVNLVDAVTSPDGLSDAYYLPSFYRDIEQKSNNQLSNSNKQSTYSASHASMEIFNISPLNEVNVEKKNAIFRPIIKGILNNTHELLNAKNEKEKEIFQERLYEYLAEYIEYKTLLFDKQLIKHSKYHLYTLKIIAMYRNVLQDKHIVELLKTFFDQYQSIFLQEKEYNARPKHDTSIKSIKIKMLMSAHSILEKNSILNNDFIEPFNSEKKQTLDYVFNCLLAYNPEEQKLGDHLNYTEEQTINDCLSMMRDVNMQESNIVNLSELFPCILDCKRENFCSVHFEIFDILNNIIATDLSCIEFIKLSILASDFLKTYEQFQGESRYFFETLEKNIKKLFSFPLSKDNKKIILDFYIRYVDLKKHLLKKCDDGSTILEHALVEFPELFFNENPFFCNSISITKSKFEDFKNKVLLMKYQSINETEISIFFDVVNSSIKKKKKKLILSMFASSLIGIVLSLPLYLILAGLCMSNNIGSGINFFTGMFIVIPVLIVCYFVLFIDSPNRSNNFIELPVRICLGLCFLITSIALFLAQKFPQMNSVFFEIFDPKYSAGSLMALSLITPTLLITGVFSLILSVYSVSNNVFCDYDFCSAYKKYFEHRDKPFSQYDEKSTNNINHGIPSLPSNDEITKHYIMYKQYDQQAMQIDTQPYIESIQTEKIELTQVGKMP